MAPGCESSDILHSDCPSVIFGDAIRALFVDGYRMQMGFVILTYPDQRGAKSHMFSHILPNEGSAPVDRNGLASGSEVGELLLTRGISPHDLRRTAITRALDQGLSYRQVQMMSGNRDPKTIIRNNHHRQNMDQNAINFTYV